MVRVSELKKRLREERLKQQESAALPETEIEVAALIIDMGYTSGGLATLYAIGDGFVAPADERIKQIEDAIRAGKGVRLKARRLKGTKRLTAIDEIAIEDDPDIPEEKVMKGVLEVLPPRLRFISNAGEIYWLDMGSINYERAGELPPGTHPVYFTAALTYSRAGKDGRIFKRVRGFYFILDEGGGDELPEEAEI